MWYPGQVDAHSFLVALTIVLGVAAVTTVVFQWLRQPVVLGYVLAGFIVGPSVPIPISADREIIQTLSELGVILLMFSLGLEFSLSKLARLGPKAGLTALVQSTLMVWVGFVCGRAFGWTTLESLFAGAIIAISSTTIIAKAFDEQGVRGPLRELVVGVLIVEDLIAILLMATLTAIASGTGLSAGEMAATTGRLVAFLVALVTIGLLLVPRGVRAVQRLGRPETTLVASIGFCFGVSLLAHAFGYSVALGAFIAGSLVAESGEEKPIAHLIEPVRDVFAAIFFVSVGMLIDPGLIARNATEIAVLVGVVVAGKVVGVVIGAFLTGNGVRTSIQAGMSLAQIGEFSFIIAGLGLSLGATREFLYPIAVAVSAITTLTTPWLIRASSGVAAWVDRKLPHPLQTFATLYGCWVEELGSRPDAGRDRPLYRRLVRLLALDAALLVALAIGAALGADPMSAQAATLLHLDPRLARFAFAALALALALPLAAGVVRLARRLGLALAEGALPEAPSGQLDLAVAPRRALVVTLQLAFVGVTGLAVLAATQPFLDGALGATFLGILLVVLGFTFWRGATDLQGHVRAGAQVIVEALLLQARRGARVEARGARSGADALSALGHLLPGLGEPTPVRVEAGSASIGRSLAELNVRGKTGATVLVIVRGKEGIPTPSAREVLQAGDVVALAGTREAIEAASALLAQRSISESD